MTSLAWWYTIFIYLYKIKMQFRVAHFLPWSPLGVMNVRSLFVGRHERSCRRVTRRDDVVRYLARHRGRPCFQTYFRCIHMNDIPRRRLRAPIYLATVINDSPRFPLGFSEFSRRLSRRTSLTNAWRMPRPSNEGGSGTTRFLDEILDEVTHRAIFIDASDGSRG